MSAPRVTVLMPVYNCERHLGAAIESILAQTFTYFQLLIVNDASTDRSRDVAASYRDARIRLVDNETNRGLGPTLNRALAMIENEYVARADQDDISFPTRLEKQVAFLDAHADVAAAGTLAIMIGESGRRLRHAEWQHPEWWRPTTDAAMAWYRIFDTPMLHTTVLFRHAVVWKELGGYDERGIPEDAELWLRVARAHRIANLGERLAAMRFTRTSMTSDPNTRERRGYRERKTEIVHTLMKEELQWPDVPRDWAQTWTDVNLPATRPSREELQALLDGVDRCAARFAELHPQWRNDAAVALHQATMHARIACKASSMPMFLSLIRRNASVAFRTAPRFFLRR